MSALPPLRRCPTCRREHRAWQDRECTVCKRDRMLGNRNYKPPWQREIEAASTQTTAKRSSPKSSEPPVLSGEGKQ